MACPPNADDLFGPQSCGRFDFTLFFEQSCFQIVPYLQKLGGPESKATAICSLAAVQLALLVSWTSTSPSLRTPASIPAAALSFSASLGLLYLSLIERTRTIRPSSIINVYILLSLLLDIPQARTLWIRQSPAPLPALFTANVVVKFCILILEARSKRGVLLRPYRQYSPERLVNVFDRTVMWWLNPLFFDGYRGRISSERLYSVDDHLAAEHLERRFLASWLKGKCDRVMRHALMAYQNTGHGSTKLRLVLATCKAVSSTAFGLLAYRLVLGAAKLTQPLLISQVTRWLVNAEKDIDAGRGLIIATALLYLVIAITNALFKRSLDRLSVKVRAMLITALHSKTLTLPSDGIEDGAIASFVTVDVVRIVDAIPDVVTLLISPLEIAAAIYLLQRQLGLSCIAPVILSVPVSLAGFAGSKQALPYQDRWLKALQSRIGYTAAALEYPRGFKLLGLTEYLIASIQELRVQELSKYAAYRKFVTVRNILAFVPDEFAAPVTLMMFSLIRGGRSLTPEVAFTSLSLIALLVKPIHGTIQAVPECLNAIASFARIEARLMTASSDWPSMETDDSVESEIEETTPGVELATIKHYPAKTPTEPLISLHSVTIRVGQEQKPVLKDVSLTILSQTLTMIIGPVGCGKTMLLRALVGDRPCSEGRRTVSPSVSEFGYCAQEVWMTNGTVRDIITGYSGYEEIWYRTIIRACELEGDISSFTSQDDTVIGSKGISLSGGQRQRLALARALYARKRVLVLDNTFSGLDHKASRRIMANVSNLCRTQRMSLIFATHAVQHLPFADQIFVLDTSGSIVQQGSFAQLNAQDGYVKSLSLREKSTPDERDASETQTAVGEVKSAIRSPKEDNLRLDLARRTGDLTVYKHYAASIGWKFGIIMLITAASFSFAERFAEVLVQWWSEDETLLSPRHPLGFWIGFHFAIATLALVSFLVFLWVFLVWTVPRSSANLHLQLLTSTFRARFSFFTSTDAGVILNHFATDMSLIEGELVGSVIRTMTGVGTCLGAAALIAAGTDYAGATIPFVIAILYVLQRFYLRTSRQLRFMELESRAPLLTHCQETQAGVGTIRAMGWQRASHLQCHRLLDRSQQPYYILLCVQRWLNLVLDLVVTAIATIVVALAVNIPSTASAGSVGLSLLNILSFNSQLSELIVAWTALETSLGAVARCRNFALHTPAELVPSGEVDTPAAWPHAGRIEFSDLSASYAPNSEEVLKHISLAIPAGTKVGICGRSGSGKSSLLLTLFRMLEPSSGAIRVDGVDLSTLSHNDIRRRLAAIPQESVCLPGSLRSHLDPFDESSDEKMTAVLAQVDLWPSLYASHPAGVLDVAIGTLGLSAGEMQLLAVARVLLLSPSRSRVLVVDEMTSAVDRATEQKVIDLITAAFAESTLLAVAHRLKTIRHFDMIVVMDAGRVVEVGHPEELLRREGLFRSMWDEGL